MIQQLGDRANGQQDFIAIAPLNAPACEVGMGLLLRGSPHNNRCQLNTNGHKKTIRPNSLRQHLMVFAMGFSMKLKNQKSKIKNLKPAVGRSSLTEPRFFTPVRCGLWAPTPGAVSHMAGRAI